MREIPFASHFSKKRTIVAGIVVCVVLIAAIAVQLSRGDRTEIAALFPSTTGLYVGDDVRVLGVTVGKVDEIEPHDGATRVTMSIDPEVMIPADAYAAIIAQSLVSGRFIQLGPVYTGGTPLEDGAEIPLQRTTVPVEWDDIKTELSSLAGALGPVDDDTDGSFSRVISTAAENLDGNGTELNRALSELSRSMATLADGRHDLFASVRNLHRFVAALSGANDQIVQFGGRLASVSDVLASSSDALGGALDDLDIAIGDVHGFVSDNRAALAESVDQLAHTTEVLESKRPEIERVLHSGPTSLTNFYQIYNPAQGTLTGAIALNNFANPVNFLCGSVEGLQANQSDHSANLCVQYLAPILNSLALNYPPLLLNPATGVQAFPEQIQYSTPELAGRVPAEPPAAPAPAPSQVPRDLASLLMPGGN
ncbi:MCE family protein [Hoyosella subflava]|uniref:Putative Mce family protein n=1 Tax=Hoyosella subflava (strain DSM 45089 / JCM 17490 / NBRC 109087 / DQS3-9A1) TaxID=443218 RepID=F6EN30_HOYSD|nr:MCE family protein [Hoyosella subflava]AEF39347.1 Putative Mce family protein [Hoyosella subflava DQS3-9A1]